MAKFKLPNNLRNQQSTSEVSNFRNMLRKTNDDICIKVANNMRDIAIEELITNYNTANTFWKLTCSYNSHATEDVLGPQFAVSQWKEWATDRGTAAIAYCVLQLIGGKVAETAKSFMTK